MGRKRAKEKIHPSRHTPSDLLHQGPTCPQPSAVNSSMDWPFDEAGALMIQSPPKAPLVNMRLLGNILELSHNSVISRKAPQKAESWSSVFPLPFLPPWNADNMGAILTATLGNECPRSPKKMTAEQKDSNLCSWHIRPRSPVSGFLPHARITYITVTSRPLYSVVFSDTQGHIVHLNWCVIKYWWFLFFFFYFPKFIMILNTFVTRKKL